MKLPLKIGSILGFMLIVFSSTPLFSQSFKGSTSENVPIIHKSNPGPYGLIRCHTMEADSIRRSLDPTLPSLWEEEVWLQNKINEFQVEQATKSSNGQPKATLLTLPVVFHIITSGSGATNINAIWVQRQVDQLNIDYRNLAGSNNSVAADVEIQFCLAMVDPSGNVLPEPGINRVTAYGAGPFNTTTMDNTVKPGTIWNPNNYINIWVANLSNSLLGYAQFPSSSGLAGLNTNGGSANTDGVVILYTSLGSTANPNPAGGVYGMGRTLTHELGHWLGLRHIWGDGACNVDDFCADTPAASSSNYGCPTGTNSCTGGSYPGNDMIENYMDYTDDGCMNIFTADQKTRIRAVLNVSPRRSTLASSTACNVPSSDDSGISAIIAPNGEVCETIITPVVTLKNYGGNTLTSCQINYNIDGGTNSTFSWTGTLASFETVDVTLPSIITTVGAHTINSFTLLPNGNTDENSTNDAISSEFNVNLAAGSAIPVSEGFTSSTFAPSNWSINNGGNSLTWVRVTNAGIAPTAGSAAKMDNFSTNIAGDVDDLVMFPVDLTGYSSVSLTFDVAHARYSASYTDRLDVVVWGCGISETQMYSKSGSTLATAPDVTTAFTPNASQWRNETIDLSSFIGNNKVYIAFRNISGYGNNIFLDNINLTGIPSSTPPIASYTSSQSSICAGSSIAFTDASTGSPTSYSWSFPGGNPATSTEANPTVIYNVEGTYTVSLTVTNGAGSNTLTSNNMITVNAVPSTPVVTVSNGCGSSVLTASGSNLIWSTGESDVSINVNTSGTYSVTQSANGCTSQSGFGTASPISIPAAPETSVNNNCGASTITATGSNLSWSTGASSPTITVSSAGIYSVTQTISGCISDVASVTAAPIPVPSISSGLTSNPTVCGLTNGSIQVNGSGSGTVSWTGAASGNSGVVTLPYIINGIGAGAYSITFNNGCTSNILNASLTDPSAPDAPAISVVDGCGSSVVSASGSGLVWSTGETTSSITVSSAGTYSVTQTVSGCTSDVASVTAAPIPVPSISSGLTSNPTVCGLTNGSIQVNGSGSGTVSWTGAASGNSGVVTLPYIINGIGAGAYSITFNNGCNSNMLNASLTDPSAPEAPAISVADGCGSSVISATGSGLVWSTGETTSSITVSSAGTYSVTQTVAGCTGSTASIDANPISIPEITVGTVTDPTSCSASDGTITINGIGTGEVTWTGVSNGAANNVVMPYTIIGLGAGSYTISFDNGCVSNSLNATVNGAIIPPSPAVTVEDYCGYSVMTASGDNLQWSTSETSSSVTVTVGGTYFVSQTIGGCTSPVTSVSADPLTIPSVTQSVFPDVCVDDPTFVLQGGLPSGGVYSGTGVTAGSFDPLAAGYGTFLITYTYTDVNTCSGQAQQTITVGCANLEDENKFLHIYPNPSNGEITVKSEGYIIKSIKVIDATGRVIIEKMTNLTPFIDLDISNFSQGVYSVLINTEDSILTERIILVK